MERLILKMSAVLLTVLMSTSFMVAPMVNAQESGGDESKESTSLTRVLSEATPEILQRFPPPPALLDAEKNMPPASMTPRPPVDISDSSVQGLHSIVLSSHHGSWEWSGWYHAKYDYPGVSEYWKCVDDYNTYYPGPEVNFFQKLVVESDYDIAAYTYYGDTELSTPGCIRYSDAWPRYRAAGSTRLVDGYNLQFQRTVTSHNSKWLPCDVYKDIHAETTRRYYFPDSITSGYYYYALVRIIYSPDGPTNWTELCNDTSSSVKHKWVVLSLDILGDAPYAYDWRWIGWWAWHPTAE